MAKIPLCQVLEEEYVRLHGPLPDHYPRGTNDGERLAAICRLIHELPQKRAALCLSGGGIRSATFGLGVLQGLAARGLLGKFDYLSTVSGGGYIGSWLSAWVHRHPQGIQGVAADLQCLSAAKLDPEPVPIRHLRAYSNYITPRLGLFSADTWTVVATYLRNLLLNWLILIPLLAAVLTIPRLGVAIVRMNPDAFFHMEGWFRSGALVFGFLSAAWAIAYISVNLPSASNARGSQNRVLRLLVYVGNRLQADKDQASFLWWGLLPLVLSALSLTAYWAWLRNSASAPPGLPIFIGFGVVVDLIGCIFYAVRLDSEGNGEKLTTFLIVLVPGVVGGVLAWLVSTKIFPNPASVAEYYGCLAVPLLLSLFLLAGALLVGLLSRRTDDDDREWWARSSAWILIVAAGWGVISPLVIFGPAWLLRIPKVVTSLGGISGLITILLGRSAKTPANQKQEAKAGWSALVMDIALKLAAPLFAVFLVVVLSLATSQLIAWVAAQCSFVIEGIDRPLVNHPFVRVPWDIAWNSWNPRDYSPFNLLRDTPLDHLMFDHRRIILHASLRLVTPLFLLMIGLGVFMAFFININKFSLHAMYRNRLVRAYLGASREPRKPNPFTGFDPDDNLGMHELRPELLHAGSFKNLQRLVLMLRDHRGFVSGYLYGKFSADTQQLFTHCQDPTHSPSDALRMAVIAELNHQLQTDSFHERPAFALFHGSWTQEIQALSKQRPQGDDGLLLNRLLLENVFCYEIASFRSHKPLPVVNIALNLVNSKNLAWQQRKAESFTVTPLHSGNCYNGYRRSKHYGGQTWKGEGISLGTAMTISGAAASPNMGYHSSPAVTFLLTLFNARLGWWLGNPGDAGEQTFQRPYPRFAIGPMVAEAFGLTDENKRYVYLSDGGHFENLGLYEMVLRRCHLIVVSDAGCDPNCDFEDLGNAIRKIRVDLGVPITLRQVRIYPRGLVKPGKYCAIGTIRYACVDGPGAGDGILLYLKPAFYGAEPVDVLNYARTNQTFPHETTTDQWFSESQLESYRMLGRHVIEETLGEMCGEDWQCLELREFISRVLRHDKASRRKLTV